MRIISFFFQYSRARRAVRSVIAGSADRYYLFIYGKFIFYSFRDAKRRSFHEHKGRYARFFYGAPVTFLRHRRISKIFHTVSPMATAIVFSFVSEMDTWIAVIPSSFARSFALP